MDEFFTLAEVAEKLKLDYDIVRDNVYGGRWPHTKFSPRNRRMQQADIDQVVRMLHHEPAPASRSDAHARRERVTGLLRAV